MYGNSNNNNNRQSNRPSSSSSSAAKFKLTNANRTPKPKIVIDGPLDSTSSSQKDNSASLVEEPPVESEAFGVKDLKMTVKSLVDNNDYISNTVKQVREKSPTDDGEDVSAIKPFDICHKKVHSGVKLKKTLHVINKEKRNQKNRGKSIELLRSGMVLLKNYISIEDQISIVKTCRDLGVGDGGFYQPGYRGRTKSHLKMMCLGKHWDCESKMYSDTRPFDNAKPPGVPDMFHDMVKKAIQDSNAHIKNENPTTYAREIIPSMSPDLCVVNFYSRSGKLGLHQDKGESENSLKKGLPVVSFSIGDSAEFLYGDTRDIDKADKVILESGDVLIFGGKSRHVYHGVPSVHPDTAPSSLQEATHMCPGRLNLTFRQYCVKSPTDDGEDRGSFIKPFDICHKKVHSGVKLKKSLLAIKEKQNQKNRGKSIDLLRSGMVLLKNYISIEDQISIVKTCRDLGVGAGGFYQPGYQGGTKSYLKMMCLGKNWDPESKLYSDTRPFDNAKPPGIPDMFHDMLTKAIQDSNAHIKNVNPTAYAREIIRSMSPDICVVKFYSTSGKLGLHQDKNESERSLKKGLPVVSFSIGDSAEFLYGDTRDIDRADKVILESGDVLIFGGKSRLVFHGVPSIYPDTAPSSLQEATDMCPGPLNLTFRQY